MPMGSNFGDVDNDGYPDIYLGSGSPSYAATVGSVLLLNQQGRRFVDITASSGTGELHKGHGVSFADIDGDGDLDIAFKVGGATPGDAHAFRLFANPGHGRDWLGLDLVGTRTNRAAIGARIAVTVHGANGAARTIHRTVSSGGSFGASPLQQHIGLGAPVRGRASASASSADSQTRPQGGWTWRSRGRRAGSRSASRTCRATGSCACAKATIGTRPWCDRQWRG